MITNIRVSRVGWLDLDSFSYHIAGKTLLPKAVLLSAYELNCRDPSINPIGLRGGYEFSDGQMDGYGWDFWVADQAKQTAVEITERIKVETITKDGQVTTALGKTKRCDRLINIAGSWAQRLTQQNAIQTPYQLNLIRGSSLLLL